MVSKAAKALREGAPVPGIRKSAASNHAQKNLRKGSYLRNALPKSFKKPSASAFATASAATDQAQREALTREQRQERSSRVDLLTGKNPAAPGVKPRGNDFGTLKVLRRETTIREFPPPPQKVHQETSHANPASLAWTTLELKPYKLSQNKHQFNSPSTKESELREKLRQQYGTSTKTLAHHHSSQIEGSSSLFVTPEPLSQSILPRKRPSVGGKGPMRQFGLYAASKARADREARANDSEYDDDYAPIPSELPKAKIYAVEQFEEEFPPFSDSSEEAEDGGPPAGELFTGFGRKRQPSVLESFPRALSQSLPRGGRQETPTSIDKHNFDTPKHGCFVHESSSEDEPVVDRRKRKPGAIGRNYAPRQTSSRPDDSEEDERALYQHTTCSRRPIVLSTRHERPALHAKTATVVHQAKHQSQAKDTSRFPIIINLDSDSVVDTADVEHLAVPGLNRDSKAENRGETNKQSVSKFERANASDERDSLFEDISNEDTELHHQITSKRNALGKRADKKLNKLDPEDESGDSIGNISLHDKSNPLFMKKATTTTSKTSRKRERSPSVIDLTCEVEDLEVDMEGWRANEVPKTKRARIAKPGFTYSDRENFISTFGPCEKSVQLRSNRRQ